MAQCPVFVSHTSTTASALNHTGIEGFPSTSIRKFTILAWVITLAARLSAVSVVSSLQSLKMILVPDAEVCMSRYNSSTKFLGFKDDVSPWVFLNSSIASSLSISIIASVLLGSQQVSKLHSAIGQYYLPSETPLRPLRRRRRRRGDFARTVPSRTLRAARSRVTPCPSRRHAQRASSVHRTRLLTGQPRDPCGRQDRPTWTQVGVSHVATHATDHPPSTNMFAPVIIDAAGEARNTTVPATSIGSPIRPSGI